MRRSGFATRTEAQTALGKVLEYQRTGIVTDDKQTVADYLTAWLHDKASTLKPTTTVRYPANRVPHHVNALARRPAGVDLAHLRGASTTRTLAGDRGRYRGAREATPRPGGAD
jgi:hypothetical protein